MAHSVVHAGQGLDTAPEAGNPLIPIFLKPERLRVLIVGGGDVAAEKLRMLVGNYRAMSVTVVAPRIGPGVRALHGRHAGVRLLERPYASTDLAGHDVVITAVGDAELSAAITAEARVGGVLVNAADRPELCDFYLGSIVAKGNLKIAISTNGKSPTMARRMREMLDAAIPDEIDTAIENLGVIRTRLGGGFRARVRALNWITAVLLIGRRGGARHNGSAVPEQTVSEQTVPEQTEAGQTAPGHTEPGPLARSPRRTLYRIAYLLVAAGVVGAMVIGNGGFAGSDALYFTAAGFVAQMIDGALGMAYGLSCTTLLLAYGMQPAAVSTSVHASELFTTLASGVSHWHGGNVNTRLLRAILLPGVIGSVAGALLLGLMVDVGPWLKLIVAAYTLVLSLVILMKGIRGVKGTRPIKREGALAIAGGFLDSFGGGGWGTVVSGTLISRGRDPVKTIGTVNVVEFFVTLASFLTLAFAVGVQDWRANLGLIAGGVLAAPLAARLPRRIPVRYMLLAVGILIGIISVRNVVGALGAFGK